MANWGAARLPDLHPFAFAELVCKFLASHRNLHFARIGFARLVLVCVFIASDCAASQRDDA
jgi:hypothetical protein